MFTSHCHKFILDIPQRFTPALLKRLTGTRQHGGVTTTGDNEVTSVIVYPSVCKAPVKFTSFVLLKKKEATPITLHKPWQHVSHNPVVLKGRSGDPQGSFRGFKADPRPQQIQHQNLIPVGKKVII